MLTEKGRIYFAAWDLLWWSCVQVNKQHTQVNKTKSSLGADTKMSCLDPSLLAHNYQGYPPILPNFTAMFMYVFDFLLSSVIIISIRLINSALWLQLSHSGMLCSKVWPSYHNMLGIKIESLSTWMIHPDWAGFHGYIWFWYRTGVCTMHHYS